MKKEKSTKFSNNYTENAMLTGKISNSSTDFNIIVEQPEEEFLYDDIDGVANIENEHVKPETEGDANTLNSHNAQINKRTELEKVKIRKTQANAFEKYLKDTGIANAFQMIFSELISKKINTEDFYSYSAARLRQIGREVDEIKTKK